MNNKWIAVLVVALVVIGSLFLFKDKGEAPAEEGLESNLPAQGGEVDEMIVEEGPQATSSPTSTETPKAPAVKEFSINNEMFSFKPSSITVNKGDTVKITFKNTGGTHDLRIDEFSGAATRILSAGESQTITFVADKSGSFEYYCSIGNHRAQGMWGTLTVN